MKLRIGYRTYEIQAMDLDDRLDSGRAGWCDRATGRIAVFPEQAPDELADTMVHEVLHAIWHERDLPEDDEERIVRALAHGLTALLKDHPEFFGEVRKALAGKRPGCLR